MMEAPTAAELQANPVVQAAFAAAWADSFVDDPVLRHEEGGFIYFGVASGDVVVRRVPPYQDLRPYRIEIRLEDDGWHVEYEFRGKGRFHTGGGPHYIIDASTGEIVSKKYYQ